ncbi:nuclear RNA export factor 1 isoform X2 [Bombina bombina]|nr:nuclear RNA export factor 1-like isoform X2 [Bombina bombina]XP_053576059.1 nuclear RNA export factor 1-like isoform X2 [Bombina bombina]XP_053576060.1 nuclear RNA export factor 1-like isoform X2 [Bombina bombina]XP_053576066.1 nuclear RNA export factor 1 isoform X2 [Bombina bombina]
MKRRKGRGPFRAKMFSEPNYKGRNKGGFPPTYRNRQEEDDGDIAMNDTHESFRPRFNPYDRGGKRRDDRLGKHRAPLHGGPPRDLAQHQDRGPAGDDRKAWFKISIPYGKKYEKTWLLTLLQNACKVPFTAVGYHIEHNQAHFYVEGSETARALRKISRSLTDRENFKIAILTRATAAPPQMESKDMKPEEVEHFKRCMEKRYDGAHQALDMKSLRSDPDLIANKIDFILGRKSYMQAMLKIIKDNVPELLSLDVSNNKLYRLDDMEELPLKAPNLKILNLSQNMLRSDRELDKVKGLKLEELWLDGNPLCDTFRDQTSYISAVRERFPKLLRLDGHELPPPITFDIETPTTLPPSKGSYLVSEEIKVLILRFLQQYYACYDSQDRQGLLNVYHEEARCSLSIPANVAQGPNRGSLGEYTKDSRNLKKVRDQTLRFKLLKHKCLNVVGFLNELPKTQHDLNSFVVDVTAQTITLLSFVVNGIFKEVEDQSVSVVRGFSRIFVAVPGSDGGLLLVNDQLFIRTASTEEIRKAFVTPAPTPSSSPVPVIAPVPQDMVQAFSSFSGMNLEWSQKCLLDNAWDFEQAAQIFLKLKSEGKIPEIAFMK